MPRKSKTTNKNVTLKACDDSEYKKNDINKKCIKAELVVDTPNATVIEEVFHRKSERRRVTRDIFLVFEEESNSRRKTRSSKKQIRPKFGHLKVEDANRSKPLLRDIKNEPKCFLNSSLTISDKLPAYTPIKKRKSISEKCVNKRKTSLKSDNSESSINSKSKNIKSLKVSTLDTSSITSESDPKCVARVNPIFLWVKQDNTRIVEVRCEDYDKRNRIRITRTSNGWRAIPRSDPTTSKVLKFYTTPLIKVKKESIRDSKNISDECESKGILGCKELIPNVISVCMSNESDTSLSGIDKICSSVENKHIKDKIDQLPNISNKLKNKLYSEKPCTISKTTAIFKTIVNSENHEIELYPPLHINSLETMNGQTKVLRSHDNIKDIDDTDNSVKKYADNLQIDTNSTESPVTNTIQSPARKKCTYQNEIDKEFLYLCPRTGLFLPNNILLAEYENEYNENIEEHNSSRRVEGCFLDSCKKGFNINVDSKKKINEDKTESFEDKTKNLKDLLDDADLLQNCDDTANSGAELIDTLVKTSCEKNLIQSNEILAKGSVEQLNSKTILGSNEIVVQLIANVSDPPKCLSFNEAGEIEGLNGELFQSNTYIESFDKDSSTMLTKPEVMLHSTTSIEEAPPQEMSSFESIEHIADNIDSNLQPLKLNDNSPKDLSYKKQEALFPPLELRSQCAVSSSSDVVKAPQDELSLTSSSETLQNLILGQFLKLNVLKKHQKESTDFGKHRHSDISEVVPEQPVKYIERVVIADNENCSGIEFEEPLKKRLRPNKHKILTKNVSKLSMIDEDPDPLTQLRLLIRNTQWKVPDPILVPKERLNAVLKSPAREIPLLITTRPELRLPEAFAYPEIIQNPNILVISMAQLEAILKNEFESDKTLALEKTQPDVTQKLSGDQISAGLTDRINDFEFALHGEHVQHMPKQVETASSSLSTNQGAVNISTGHTNSVYSPSKSKHEYTKMLQIDSPLLDMNSTPLGDLNHMLWLPYFSRLSQSIGTSIKNQTSLLDKCSNIVPFFNAQLKGITNMKEVLRNIAISKISDKSFLNTNEELSFFQKIVENQIFRVPQLNEVEADSSQVITSVTAENKSALIEKSKPNLEFFNLNEMEQNAFLNNKQIYTSTCKFQTNETLVQEKSYNLRSSVASRHYDKSKPYSNYNPKQIIHNKPRLTCKSLSNLLDPEYSMLPPSSSSIPLIQKLSSDFPKNGSEFKGSSSECKNNNTNIEGNFVPPCHSQCSNKNIGIETNIDRNQHKPKEHKNYRSNSEDVSVTADTNVPLWHPLFGSNTKTLYKSPWKWTTVTATGD